MGNRKYSNKGVNSQRNAAPAPKDNSTLYATAIGVGLVVIIIIAIAIAILSGNGSSGTPSSTTAAATPAVTIDMEEVEATIDSMEAEDFSETDKESDYVKITFRDHGDVIIYLDEEVAPITVENFKSLVADGFYDGLTMHRIVKGFMIQGGDPDGNGSGGSSKTIKGEFAINGYNNPLNHVKGVISMARLGYPYDSATSQFFITNDTSDNISTSLDG